MREVLFTKYSMERSPQFAIRTSIVQEGERRWAEKVPLTREADAHVKRLASSYDKLCRLYEGTRVRPCPVVVENGAARFEFLEGDFFQEKLERLIAAKNEEGIIALCKDFASIVRSGAEVEQFQKTPEFVRVFGDADLPVGLTAMPFSNVDWIFENLVEGKDGGITLIDYEWCFDFPVPLEYVLYRALYFTFEKFGMLGFLDQRLCPFLGISTESIPLLWELEKKFGCYMEQGDHLDTAWHGYMPILQKSCDWQQELERNRQEWERQRQELEQRHKELEQELIRQHEEIRRGLAQQCENLRQQLLQTQYAYSVISNAFFWKVTKPARVMADALKALLKKYRTQD